MTVKTKPTNPTAQAYSEWDIAAQHFNKELFGGKLPPCLITLQRKAGAYGYFSGDRFHAKHGEKVKGGTVQKTTDEIAMNPNHLGGRSDKENLSTLAHELCHLWQHHFGKPSRTSYHNKEWAEKMKTIGLQPTSTGAEGGKETGQKVSHIIIKGGAFQKSCARLLATGFKLSWHDPHTDAAGKAKKKKNDRIKYTCPDCGLNAWAKPAASLGCTDCDVPLEPDDTEA